MQPHTIRPLSRNRKTAFLVTVWLALFLLLSGGAGVVGTAQSPSQENAAAVAQPTPQERVLIDRVPKHVPIKVKVKKLNNEKWYSDVEVEVTNTGDKPIYYLLLALFFDDVTMNHGMRIGFPMRYGRPELSRIGNRATPEDVPILPGETYVFKAHEGLAKGLEGFRVKHNMRRPKKIGIRFEILNFGDNTGFVTTGGLPVPRPRAANAPCRDEGDGRALVLTAIHY